MAMNGFEVHESQKNFEQAVDRLEKDCEVSAENRRLILSFAEERIKLKCQVSPWNAPPNP
jgi:hypothetical protein